MNPASTRSPDQVCTYSVAQFCAAHNITKVFFYKLLKQGNGPRIMKVGARTLVSIEAASEWRRKMEIETASAIAKPRRAER